MSREDLKDSQELHIFTCVKFNLINILILGSLTFHARFRTSSETSGYEPMHVMVVAVTIENTAMLKKKEKEKEEAEAAGASKAKEQNSDEDGSHGDKTKEQKSDDDNHGDTVTVEIADKQLSKQMSHDDKSAHELIKKSSHKPDKSHGQKTSSNSKRVI